MKSPIPAETTNLWRSVVGGALWVYASFALGKLAVFATTVMLARLLTAEQFGLVGYALLVVACVDVIKDLGIGSALIAYSGSGDPRSVRSTAFALSVASGAVLAGLIVVAAPLVGWFFGEAEAISLTQVMAIGIAVSGLGRTHEALLQKELSFGRKLIPDLGQSIVKGLVSIWLASAGFGAWSIAWGQVAGVCASTLLSWVVYPWIPNSAMRLGIARELAGFGSQLMAVNFVAALLLNTDYIIVGRLLGPEALGLYTLAFKLPDLLLVNLCWVLSRVLFPFFSRLVGDRASLRVAYLAAFRFVSIVAIPLGLGLAATAPSVVLVLFGPQWAAAVLTMQILAVYSTLHALSFHAGDVLKAVGRGGLLVRLSLVSMVLAVPAMLAGAHWYGLAGVAVTWIVVDSARFLLSLNALRHEVDLDPRDLLAALRPPLLAGLVMFGCVWLVGSARGEPGPLTLVVQVAAGVVSYSAALFMLNPRVVAEMKMLAGLLRPSASASPAQQGSLDGGVSTTEAAR